MNRIVRKVIPNAVVNLLKHYPLAVLANLQRRFPSRGMTIIGVTGTDGKTTTVNMIYQILKASGKKVSMISTINAVIGDNKLDTGFHVTSPSARDVQRYIAEAKKSGSQYMILEVTSHSLEQYRFWGIKFDIAVITNITHEHLDYHKTFEKYRLAKAKILKKVRWAILNKDDKNFKFLEAKAKANGDRVFEVSLREKADLNLKRFPLKLKVAGDYNLLNALEAAAVGQVLGVDNQTIKQTLSHFSNLSGRMEEIKNNRGVKIYVDFAHTPNGLENALTTLRKQRTNGGRLIAIIGAEGNRDPGKRVPMGEIAAKLADRVIIAPVDPRGQLDKINLQILEGVMRIDKAKAVIENDRQKAIEMALEMSKKGDIVGIFGKGHETSMNLDGKKEVPWSDKQAVERVLNIAKQI